LARGRGRSRGHSRRSRGRNRNKYLGRGCRSPPCVRDRGAPGLDRASEYRAILRRILQDYRRHRITRATARGRLLLLYRLTYPSHNSKARRLSARTREALRREIKRAMEEI
jgi:hypothetical protein